MSEIKQVWGIIKDYQCADLKMVQDPALAVFQRQQAIIDDLKAQLNNMETCYIEKKKEVEGLQARANKALSVTGNYCDEDDAALLVFVLEKALRGES